MILDRIARFIYGKRTEAHPCGLDTPPLSAFRLDWKAGKLGQPRRIRYLSVGPLLIMSGWCAKPRHSLLSEGLSRPASATDDVMALAPFRGESSSATFHLPIQAVRDNSFLSCRFLKNPLSMQHNADGDVL